MKHENTWAVYGIFCPMGTGLRYIGITHQNRLSLRLAHHFYSYDINTKKGEWLDNIKSNNLIDATKIEVIEGNLFKWDAFEKERKWIHHFEILGCDLVNITHIKSKGTPETKEDSFICIGLPINDKDVYELILGKQRELKTTSRKKPTYNTVINSLLEELIEFKKIK